MRGARVRKFPVVKQLADVARYHNFFSSIPVVEDYAAGCTVGATIAADLAGSLADANLFERQERFAFAMLDLLNSGASRGVAVGFCHTLAKCLTLDFDATRAAALADDARAADHARRWK